MQVSHPLHFFEGHVLEEFVYLDARPGKKNSVEAEILELRVVGVWAKVDYIFFDVDKFFDVGIGDCVEEDSLAEFSGEL